MDEVPEEKDHEIYVSATEKIRIEELKEMTRLKEDAGRLTVGGRFDSSRSTGGTCHTDR